jgi:hypothetical protein
MNLYKILFLFSFQHNIKKPVINKSCEQCKFFIERTNDEYHLPDNINKCKKFSYISKLSNKIKYEYTDDCRNNETKCGLEGKFFELK